MSEADLITAINKAKTKDELLKIEKEILSAGQSSEPIHEAIDAKKIEFRGGGESAATRNAQENQRNDPTENPGNPQKDDGKQCYFRIEIPLFLQKFPHPPSEQ